MVGSGFTNPGQSYFSTFRCFSAQVSVQKMDANLGHRAWSSFRHYRAGKEGVVEIESEWTGRKREQVGMPLRVKDRELPHPSKIGLGGAPGGVARVVGHQAGYVGKVADNLGKNMLTAGTKTTGTLASTIGFNSSDWTTWVSAGITAADFVPVLSDFTTPVAIAWDAGVAAYKVYQCPK